jgi:hypothetical protein
MGRSKRPSNSTEIFYQMRLGSLGKRLSRSKQTNVHGKMSRSHSWQNSYQNLGLFLWLHHIPHSRCSDKIWVTLSSTTLQIHWRDPMGFQLANFWCELSSLAASLKLYHVCTTV